MSTKKAYVALFFRLYNPADFEHLIVSPEVKEMFQYIQRYIPQKIDLETRLRPFIPEYIAAVGDADAFLKVGLTKMIIKSLMAYKFILLILRS